MGARRERLSRHRAPRYSGFDPERNSQAEGKRWQKRCVHTDSRKVGLRGNFLRGDNGVETVVGPCNRLAKRRERDCNPLNAKEATNWKPATVLIWERFL